MSRTTTLYSRINRKPLRGCFITNVKSKARFHASDFALNLGHIATAMLPLCNNELTERCCHFGLTFVMKRPLKSKTTGAENISGIGRVIYTDVKLFYFNAL